jgi:L-ribulokinase
LGTKYTLGVDFGTDSVRVVLIDTNNGHTLATAVSYYDRWSRKLYCNPSISQFRQHPLDYLQSLKEAILDTLKNQPQDVKQNVAGISIDTTGSTPVAVNREGVPLSLTPGFENNPNAMFILWKDHTANAEADEINKLARSWHTDYTKYEGGIYSSEWFWAKILRTIRTDAAVREAAFSWVEHCDWISAILTGNSDPLDMKRSRCAAGHKAMWHESFDGLPPENFLTSLDPLLEGYRKRLYKDTYTSDKSMGTISSEWASKTGLPESVVVGIGGFDCHMGAVGAEIKPYDFVRVMGTSTCDLVIISPEELGDTLVKGICGQVNGSVVPNMIGLEAGQSAYGDYYAWFQNLITEPVKNILGEEVSTQLAGRLLPYLSAEAAKIPLSIEDPVATDWINGRRTPDANHQLKAGFMGLNLGVDSIRLFKMIVEATAFGSKAIVDRFIEEGIQIKQVVAIGGVAKKSPFVMQTLCDVLNMPIKVVASDQACALGAAMNAAVAAGIYGSVEEAQAKMGQGFEEYYTPRTENVDIYQALYNKYKTFGNFIEKS